MRTEDFKRGVVSVLLAFALVFSMISVAPPASPGELIIDPGGTTIEVVQGDTFLIRHVLEWDEAQDGAYGITIAWDCYDNKPEENFTFVENSAYFTTGDYVGESILAEITWLVVPSPDYPGSTRYILSVKCPANKKDSRDGRFNVDITLSASGVGEVPHIPGDHVIPFQSAGIIIVEKSPKFWNRDPITIRVLEPVPECGVDVTVEPKHQRGTPGTWLTFLVTVHNTGSVEDNYHLWVENDGWQMENIWLENEQLENIRPGENKVTKLHVGIPEDAEPCTHKEIVVVAESEFCGATDNDNALIQVVSAYLHSEEGLIDLDNPVCTQWHELYPNFSKRYHLTSWEDTNGDGKLSPSDQIDMTDNETGEVDNYHVKDVTVTLLISKKPDRVENMYVEFEGDFENWDNLKKDPECTQWHEIWPVFSKRYHLMSWEDENDDNVLGPSDQIEMMDKETGEDYDPGQLLQVYWYHVDEVATDLVLCKKPPVVVLEVEVSISPESKSGAPGETLTYEVTVKNTGTVEDTYVLEASDNAIPSWDPTVSPTSLTVPKNENMTATLSVVISEEPSGTEDEITITVTSSTDPTVSDNATCIARAVVIRGVEVSISPSYQSGLPGATLNYVVTVKNTGNVSDNYGLWIADTADWAPTLSPSSLSVPAGENRTATLSPTIPSGTPDCTRDNIIVFAISQADSTVRDNASCIAHAAWGPPDYIYLTWATPDTAHTINVSWRTGGNYVGEVRYDNEPRGSDPDAYSYSTGGTGGLTTPELTGYIHHVELTGLEPDTIYYFICGNPSYGWSDEQSFRTAPDQRTSFRFATGGDSRDDNRWDYHDYWPSARDDVSREMAERNPSFVLFIGDYLWSSEDPGPGYAENDTWDNWLGAAFKYWRTDDDRLIPQIPVIGNHEIVYPEPSNYDPETQATNYYTVFNLPGNERWYALSWGPDLRIIVLDSEVLWESADAWQEQLEWLESELENSENYLWKVAAFHRPIVSSGGWNWHGRLEDWGYLFTKYGVDVVFQAHIHWYDRLYPIDSDPPPGEIAPLGEGVVYLVSGGWGAPLSSGSPQEYTAYGPESIYHFVLVDLFENGTFHSQAIDRYGTVFDEFSIYRDVGVSILPGEKDGPTGETLNYEVTVKNSGNVTDSYELNVWDSAGWGPTLDNYLFESVPPGESRVTTLRVTIPGDAEPGVEDNITVTATSQTDSTISDSAHCIARAIEIVVGWDASITVTFSGGRDGAIFGVRPDATDNFDKVYDIPEPPAPPEPPYVQAYFYYPGQTLSDLHRSCLAPENLMEWPLRIEYADDIEDITLMWSVENIPSEYFVLLYRGGDLVADMRMEDNYAFEASTGSHDFRIVVGTAMSFTLELTQGWNMISFPVLPENLSPDSIFGGYYVLYRRDAENKRYVLHADSGSFIEPDPGIEAGVGYWAYVLENGNVNLLGVPVSQLTLSLRQGWSLIGPPYGGSSIADPADDPDKSFLPYVFTWNVHEKSYRMTQLLEAGKGYWAYALRDCMLTLKSQNFYGGEK